MISYVASAPRVVYETLLTAHLFTKSDIKTMVIPVTFFAVATVPNANPVRTCAAVFWIWIHLLQCAVSNQTLDASEDALNKSYRPLPSGRISHRNALILRWVLVPVCWAHSALYSAELLYASVSLAALGIAYNELAGSSHWLLRNLLNGAAYASFEAGAVLIAGGDLHTLDVIEVAAIVLSSGIVSTTIHAADFKDEHGDRSVGRLTIPIVFPSAARYTMLVPLLLWGACLSFVWQLDGVAAGALMALGLYVGARFVACNTVYEDEVSYYWYNVWLSVVHSLPRYYRYCHGSAI